MKDIINLVQVLSDEKGVSREIVFEALEEALAVAVKKHYKAEWDVRVSIDRKTGDYIAFRRWTVIDPEAAEVEAEPSFEEGEVPERNPEAEISLEDAQAKQADVAIGDVIEEQLEEADYGRISAQNAKHVIMQKVREAKRKQVFIEYQDKIGILVNGTAKRVTRDYILLDLGRDLEAMLERSQMLPREAVRMGDRIRAYLYEVREEQRGPQLFLSRIHPQFLVELFKLEVPEVSEELIEIKGAARDPGARAKIAVKTNDKRIDPIGACVGMRGTRVQAVSNELGGERIDIVLWDDEPVQFVINAMAPAEIDSITVEEELHAMDVVVKEATLAQAIGRGGQNVNLASQLTGWEINVMTEDQATEKETSESQSIVQSFMESLDLDEEVATLLVTEGFGTIEEVAYVVPDEMAEIEGFDEETVAELQARAKDVLLKKALSGGDSAKPADDLLEMEGMDPELAQKLADREIISMEDLAEQSVDDLMEIEGMDNERAAALIMAARAPWFE